MDSWYTGDALVRGLGSGVEKFLKTGRVQILVEEGRLLAWPIGVRACVNLQPQTSADAAVVVRFLLGSTVRNSDEKDVNCGSVHSCSD